MWFFCTVQNTFLRTVVDRSAAPESIRWPDVAYDPSSYPPPQWQGRLPTRIPIFWSNLLDLVGIWLGGMPDLLSFPCLLCRWSTQVWLMWTTLQRHLCAKHMASRVCQPWHWWRHHDHHGNPRVHPPMPSDIMERPYQGTIIGEWFGRNSSMTPSHVSSPALWHVFFCEAAGWHNQGQDGPLACKNNCR